MDSSSSTDLITACLLVENNQLVDQLRLMITLAFKIEPVLEKTNNLGSDQV